MTKLYQRSIAEQFADLKHEKTIVSNPNGHTPSEIRGAAISVFASLTSTPEEARMADELIQRMFRVAEPK